MFGWFCKVIETGEPLNEEFPVKYPGINATWLRSQVVKLGDGLAVTFSDISEAKATQERYVHLAEFTDSVFQNAPFSIVATDTTGTITAMNVAAEKLTGYRREELVGTAPLTVLHDERELLGKVLSIDPAATLEQFGFHVLTAGAALGEMEEQEWTLLRKDGARTPINLAVRAVTTDTGEVTGFVSIAFDITERRQMLDYVTHLATHDQLTGLAGRALLHDKTVEAVEVARRCGTKVAVFVIDLDHFKRINDSLGHSSGDQLLVEAARRLTRSVRSTDVVSRVGGDEFVVVMPDITSVEDVEQCAANLVCEAGARDLDRRAPGAADGECWGVHLSGFRCRCEAPVEAGGFGNVCREGEWEEPVPDFQREHAAGDGGTADDGARAAPCADEWRDDASTISRRSL